MERAWDNLPSLALVNIFCRTSIVERIRSVPLVCRSWCDASRDPRCWASMVADSYFSSSSAIEDTFIRSRFKPHTQFYAAEPVTNDRRGVPRLQTLIQRANGGLQITSLFLPPFLTPPNRRPNDNALFRLIAHRCPNLKHLSFYGSYRASTEAILEVIRSCKKLELIDFADSPYFSSLILEEIGNCCPNLRGIRSSGSVESSTASALATNFPGLRLLNLSGTPILEKDLLTIVSGCLGLQYLDVRECSLWCDIRLAQRASAQIAEFLYEFELCYDSEVDDFDDADDVYLYGDLNDYGFGDWDDSHLW